MTFAPAEGPAVSITLSNKVNNSATLNSAMSAQEERNAENKPAPYLPQELVVAAQKLEEELQQT